MASFDRESKLGFPALTRSAAPDLFPQTLPLLVGDKQASFSVGDRQPHFPRGDRRPFFTFPGGDRLLRRFGIDSNMSGSKIGTQEEEQKRKARAERFGLKVDNPVDEAAKKKARLERFAPNSKHTTLEEEKMKARAIRHVVSFGPLHDALSGSVGKL